MDGALAFVGGAGYADWWRDAIKDEPSWRDTMFRAQGDAVRGVGDFNERTRGLATSLISTAFEVADPRGLLKRAGTYPGVLPFLHLDHFYYDNHLALQHLRVHRNSKILLASDHLPLSADSDLKRAT